MFGASTPVSEAIIAKMLGNKDNPCNPYHACHGMSSSQCSTMPASQGYLDSIDVVSECSTVQSEDCIDTASQASDNESECCMEVIEDYIDVAPHPSEAYNEDAGPCDNPRQRQGIILFDWDDTLLPTTSLGESVGATDLRRHSHLVAHVLRSACMVARVSIVTLSVRPWVVESAKHYLSAVDIPALLDELNIRVYYAREYATNAQPGWVPNTVGDGQLLKRYAMAQCINEQYATNLLGSQHLNVLSVGDSIMEKEALKELMDEWMMAGVHSKTPYCKTVKFLDRPSVPQLITELTQLVPRLKRMVLSEGSFDMFVDASLQLV